MAFPSRRRVLGIVGSASAALLAGCAVDVPGSEEGPGGHLFVRNRTDDQRRIRLTVTDTSDDEQVIEARYRVPAETVLEFEEVLASGNTYAIQVIQPGVDGQAEGQLSVTAETCEEGDPSDKLDVAVLLTTHGPDIITYDCDDSYDRDADLNYVEPADYFVTETPAES